MNLGSKLQRVAVTMPESGIGRGLVAANDKELALTGDGECALTEGILSGIELLESLDICALVVDAGLRIAHANRCASKNLAAGEGLNRSRAGDLTTDSPEDTAVLSTKIADACRGGDGGALLVHRSAHGLPFLVRVARFREGAGLALVCFRAPSSRLKHSRETLTALFKLSEAELQVALDLAGGADLPQIADRRGVRLSTVRSQVAALMSKTGTRRQAELVALIAGLAADGV